MHTYSCGAGAGCAHRHTPCFQIVTFTHTGIVGRHEHHHSSAHSSACLVRPVRHHHQGLLADPRRAHNESTLTMIPQWANKARRLMFHELPPRPLPNKAASITLHYRAPPGPPPFGAAC
eukprot:739960-Prorocentrum_minimum.AAC.1